MISTHRLAQFHRMPPIAARFSCIWPELLAATLTLFGHISSEFGQLGADANRVWRHLPKLGKVIRLCAPNVGHILADGRQSGESMGRSAQACSLRFQNCAGMFWGSVFIRTQSVQASAAALHGLSCSPSSHVCASSGCGPPWQVSWNFFSEASWRDCIDSPARRCAEMRRARSTVHLQIGSENVVLALPRIPSCSLFRGDFHQSAGQLAYIVWTLTGLGQPLA